MKKIIIFLLKAVIIAIPICFIGLLSIVAWNNWPQLKRGTFDPVEAYGLHIRSVARRQYLVIEMHGDQFILKKNGWQPSDIVEARTVPGTPVPVEGRWYNISTYGDRYIFEECAEPALPLWETEWE